MISFAYWVLNNDGVDSETVPYIIILNNNKYKFHVIFNSYVFTSACIAWMEAHQRCLFEYKLFN